jgi:hypothetical protein
VHAGFPSEAGGAPPEDDENNFVKLNMDSELRFLKTGINTNIKGVCA